MVIPNLNFLNITNSFPKYQVALPEFILQTLLVITHDIYYSIETLETINFGVIMEISFSRNLGDSPRSVFRMVFYSL